MDPVIVVFGFGIGLLIGMTGMGGGSLMTPLLILVFGIQPVTAVGTDIFYGAVTKTAGGWRHLKHKTVHRGIAFWLAVGSVPMAIAGVWLIEILQHSYGEDEVNKVVLGMVGCGPAGRRGRDADPGAVPARRDPGALRDAPLPPPHHRRVDHRRDHRLRDRPHLGRQRHPDRDRPDRGLPPDAPARRRHRRLPRRDPAVGGRASPTGSAATSTSGSPANILVGSIPGVLLGSQLAVRVPTGLPAQRPRHGADRRRRSR